MFTSYKSNSKCWPTVQYCSIPPLCLVSSSSTPSPLRSPPTPPFSCFLSLTNFNQASLPTGPWTRTPWPTWVQCQTGFPFQLILTVSIKLAPLPGDQNSASIRHSKGCIQYGQQGRQTSIWLSSSLLLRSPHCSLVSTYKTHTFKDKLI
jgi:hypothetical protein